MQAHGARCRIVQADLDAAVACNRFKRAAAGFGAYRSVGGVKIGVTAKILCVDRAVGGLSLEIALEPQQTQPAIRRVQTRFTFYTVHFDASVGGGYQLKYGFARHTQGKSDAFVAEPISSADCANPNGRRRGVYIDLDVLERIAEAGVLGAVDFDRGLNPSCYIDGAVERLDGNASPRIQRVVGMKVLFESIRVAPVADVNAAREQRHGSQQSHPRCGKSHRSPR